MTDARINWRETQVKAYIKDLTTELATELVNVLEAQTKVNIRDNGQIDTGFMVNSVYGINPSRSRYHQAKVEAEQRTVNRSGEAVDHSNDMAPEVDRGDALGAVCVGASYAVYQETRRSFLYKAMIDVVPKFGGIVRLVKR